MSVSWNDHEMKWQLWKWCFTVQNAIIVRFLKTISVYYRENFKYNKVLDIWDGANCVTIYGVLWSQRKDIKKMHCARLWVVTGLHENRNLGSKVSTVLPLQFFEGIWNGYFHICTAKLLLLRRSWWFYVTWQPRPLHGEIPCQSSYLRRIWIYNK